MNVKFEIEKSSSGGFRLKNSDRGARKKNENSYTTDFRSSNSHVMNRLLGDIYSPSIFTRNGGLSRVL